MAAGSTMIQSDMTASAYPSFSGSFDLPQVVKRHQSIKVSPNKFGLGSADSTPSSPMKEEFIR